MIKKIAFTLILLTNILITHHCLASNDFDGYIVTLKDYETVSLFSGEDITDTIEPVVPDKNIYKVNTDEELQELIDAGIVEFAEPDHIVTLFDSLFVPADSYFTKMDSTTGVKCQYGIGMTNTDFAWDMGIFGNDVRIGIIDSGIYPHNELLANTLPGYNFTVSSSVCSKGNNCTNTDCDHYDYVDTYSHGTFCAGIMAAEANTAHIIGATPVAKVIPLRSFINQNAAVSNIVQAVYSAVDKFDCDVINMSFGLRSSSTSLKNAIAYAKKNNVLVVAAAGNYSSSSTVYPGAYDGVVCVGSVDSAGNKSSFSSYGSFVDIAAPGTDIYSCSLSANGLSHTSGTSFAAPYVTSAAAMCKMINPDITNDEFEELVTSTATPFADGFGYSLGSGILNVEDMLLSLMEGKDIYYSPINRFYDKTFRMISNFTDSDFNFIDMWKGNTTFAYTDVSLPSQSIYMTEFEEESSSINYIWSGITSLKPIHKDEFVLE